MALERCKEVSKMITLWRQPCLKACVIFTLVDMLLCSGAAAIDLRAIRDIESGGNARAYNKRSGATGMYQITQPVIDDFNKAYAKYGTSGVNKVKLNDMYDEASASQMSSWYLGQRIPQMLVAYKLPVTEDNVLAAYNAGVGTTKKSYRTGAALPSETVEYQKRYKKALSKYLNS